MSKHDLAVVDETVHLTNAWMKQLMEYTGCTNRQLAFTSFRAVLRALRDRMTVNDAAHFGAQLPALIRGFYYESWHPAGTPSKDYSEEQFLNHVERELRVESEVPVRVFVRAVFRLLSERISDGEIDKVKRRLPKKLGTLWPIQHAVKVDGDRESSHA